MQTLPLPLKDEILFPGNSLFHFKRIAQRKRQQHFPISISVQKKHPAKILDTSHSTKKVTRVQNPKTEIIISQQPNKPSIDLRNHINPTPHFQKSDL